MCKIEHSPHTPKYSPPYMAKAAGLLVCIARRRKKENNPIWREKKKQSNLISSTLQSPQFDQMVPRWHITQIETHSHHYQIQLFFRDIELNFPCGSNSFSGFFLQDITRIENHSYHNTRYKFSYGIPFSTFLITAISFFEDCFMTSLW